MGRMSRLTRDGRIHFARLILRYEQGQGKVMFPCSADLAQDWQPYPVDPYSAISDAYTYCRWTQKIVTQTTFPRNPDVCAPTPIACLLLVHTGLLDLSLGRQHLLLFVPQSFHLRLVPFVELFFEPVEKHIRLCKSYYARGGIIVTT